jgi:hypothetical protein
MQEERDWYLRKLHSIQVVLFLSLEEEEERV